MQEKENLVIVESPAKAKTIERFLGKGYRVMSSYGHIRDLKAKELSVDLESLEPCYEVPADKAKVVDSLRSAASGAQRVWLASDEDREGEAISWHLQEVLSLDPERTLRIVFHEITRPAILSAIDHPRRINMSLVDAQQARRVLDRIVGFNLSPVLWRKVKPSLSAGRVQSVAVRLIVEREREIRRFKTERYFRVSGVFALPGGGREIKGDLDRKFANSEEAEAFLKRCRKAAFAVESVAKKPVKRSPAPPFTTSTLQQEAARKLGFSVSQTMMIAQRLYESGFITYMRTDSVNLSTLCLEAAKAEITSVYGKEYSRPRNYQTHTRGAQEAHEAIRPAYIDKAEIEGTAQEQRLYDLIRKRTLASQMADAAIEKTVITIAMSETADGGGESSFAFTASGEVTLFDGFTKVYKESGDDETETAASSGAMPRVEQGDCLERREITATERFTQSPARYTEASLVKKMEELGIGRPSTYAPTISTIQQRGYVEKGDIKGTLRQYASLTLAGDTISAETKKETAGKEKGKLLPTDIGTVVNDFLSDNFPEIMDYNFTANIEEKFDEIAEGRLARSEMLKEFWANFSPEITSVLSARQEHKPGEREMGKDPETGKTVYVKIGRFGPIVQIGDASGDEKPRFAQLPKGKTMDSITLGEALELFRLPRTVGIIDGKEAQTGIGRFGPYIKYDGKYTSLPATEDPLTVSLETVEAVLAGKRQDEERRHIKQFEQEPAMEIINGRYGPYIAYGGKNYRIPRKLHSTAATLTYEECKKIVDDAPEKTAASVKRRRK